MSDDASDQETLERLGYDPTLMIRLLGLAPANKEEVRLLGRMTAWPRSPSEREIIDRLLTLERLDRKIMAYEDRLSAVALDRSPAIVQRAVLASRTYGMSLWPVLAGPSERPEHQLHVSDRVDLRRLDGGETDEQSAWEDLGEALAQAGAWPSIAEPRWPYAGSKKQDVRYLSRWNLHRLAAPRGPQIQHPHPGFPAIAFTATVSSSWVENLASLVALVLGYGFSSTTDLSRQVDEPSRYTPKTEVRNRVHSQLLRDPGDRRVWAHASKFDATHPGSPWAPSPGTTHPDLVHVHLVEDDDLLDATEADRRNVRTFGPGDKEQWKHARDAALRNAPRSERVLLLSVPHAKGSLTDKWRHTFDRVLCVLHFLEGLGFEPSAGLGPSQARWVEDGDGLVRPAFTWLREHGAPYVKAPEYVPVGERKDVAHLVRNQ